ncbi:hypothetical protein ALI22I_33820 [Saccharothrix sp. ALI-22-I]|uniref:hypothetical protein n=1 Tax=Saccharothrix sp. ALI-22-I TaxID=1933778 RepID=UPI00097C665B|nr:hypothetical protein [Saccharothrix sp. ALI-22-I]ONI83478.1 hypothetical protein ALI22I_33820 [Saccharothrix sp. ALI-22-I]
MTAPAVETDELDDHEDEGPDYTEGYEPCRADDCDGDANDGQGWDGYCALHSDAADDGENYWC